MAWKSWAGRPPTDGWYVSDCPADVEIPQGFRFIQEGAFQNQQGLETIVLPESLTEIQASAFEGCTHLRRVRGCPALPLCRCSR